MALSRRAFSDYDVHDPQRDRICGYFRPPATASHSLLTTPADELRQFSPDGKWIAYDSDEAGRREVYVQGFDPGRVPAAAVGKWLISAAGVTSRVASRW